MPDPVIVSWSGGKDCCLALDAVLNSGTYEVVALLTALTGDYDAVTTHGTPRVLIEAQARSLGLPLKTMVLPRNPPNAIYETALEEALRPFRDAGITRVVYGDLFLEDIRQYRDDFLRRHGMTAIYPLWQRDTAQLARDMITVGYRAVVTSVRAGALDKSFAGRIIDAEFLAQLPPGVDPCGENGEFHTFVCGGPLFHQPVTLSVGAAVLRDGHWVCELTSGD